jgi:LysM repeat protein
MIARQKVRSLFSIMMVLALVATMAFAALPANAQSACPSGFEAYQIRRGDTLAQIARLYGVSYAQLRADNNIPDLNLIYYGTVLCINPANITTGLVPPPPVGEACPIQRGYTLSGVAFATGATLRAIAQNNRIANPDLIYAGETLLIPAPGTGC